MTTTAPLLLINGPVMCEAMLDKCGTSPVRKWVPTCDSEHSWRLHSAASPEHQSAGTMSCYLTWSHYPDTEPTSPYPILIMSSTRLGSRDLQIPRSPITGGGHSLLIQPPWMISYNFVVSIDLCFISSTRCHRVEVIFWQLLFILLHCRCFLVTLSFYRAIETILSINILST